MPRGTAKFETMKMVDVKSSERKIPNNKPIDIDMNDRMRLEDKKDVKLIEIDPLRSINKGLNEFIETKSVVHRALAGGTLGAIIGSNTGDEKDEATNAVRGGATGAALGALGGALAKDIVKAKMKPRTGNAVFKREGLSRMAAAGGATLGGIAGGVFGRKPNSKEKKIEEDILRKMKGLNELDDSIETKGLLNFEKSPILNTLKKVGNTKPIKGAAKYGTIGATGYFTLKPEDVKVKAMDVGKLAKVAIPAVAGGFIASDTANRLQDRRAKKRDDGIVEEIVERLKTNRE